MLFTCPHCQQNVEAGPECAGLTVSCPHRSCSKQFFLAAESFSRAIPTVNSYPPVATSPTSPMMEAKTSVNYHALDKRRPTTNTSTPSSLLVITPVNRSKKIDETSLRLKHCVIFGVTGTVLTLALWLSLRFLGDLLPAKDKPANFDIWLRVGAAIIPILFALRGWISGPKLQRQTERMNAEAVKKAHCSVCGAQLAVTARTINYSAFSYQWSWESATFCPACTATMCFVEGCAHVSIGGYKQHLHVGSGKIKATIRSDACLCAHHRHLVESDFGGVYKRKLEFTAAVRTNQRPCKKSCVS